MKTLEATLDEWRLLVKITDKIKVMKPWEYFQDMEVFALSLPEEEELVYASIMGYHGMCYGLSFYSGVDGFTDLSTVAYEITDESYLNYSTMNLQFYSVYFDNQENVSHMQKEVFDKLGIDKEDYSHFTVKEKGCFPDDPDGEEVEKYTLYIAALIEALECYFKNEEKVNFDKEIYVYNVEDKSGEAVEVAFEPRIYEPIIFSDIKYLNKLKKKETSSDVWEMYYNYTNQGFEREDGRIENSRMIVTASITREYLQDFYLLKPFDDENEEVLRTFLKQVEEHGKPKQLLFQNIRLLPLLGPTCEYLGIELDVSDEFVIIDSFLESFHAYMNEKELVS